MKNIKTKNPDGTYSGHFELNDGTKVPYNSGGGENLCFWMAVAQSQKKYDNSNEKALISDAKELKQNAFQSLDPTLLHHLHQNQRDHVAKNGSNIFALTGGKKNRINRPLANATPEAVEKQKQRLDNEETRLKAIQ